MFVIVIILTQNAWGMREICTKLWWETPKERDHSEDRDVDGSMGLEWILGTLAEG
jgi:hypothetical protein